MLHAAVDKMCHFPIPAGSYGIYHFTQRKCGVKSREIQFPHGSDSVAHVAREKHGCQMTKAKNLYCGRLVLRGLKDYGSAMLRFEIVPPPIKTGAIQRKDGVKFCHPATVIKHPLPVMIQFNRALQRTRSSLKGSPSQLYATFNFLSD